MAMLYNGFFFLQIGTTFTNNVADSVKCYVFICYVRESGQREPLIDVLLLEIFEKLHEKLSFHLQPLPLLWPGLRPHIFMHFYLLGDKSFQKQNLRRGYKLTLSLIFKSTNFISHITFSNATLCSLYRTDKAFGGVSIL